MVAFRFSWPLLGLLGRLGSDAEAHSFPSSISSERWHFKFIKFREVDRGADTLARFLNLLT